MLVPVRFFLFRKSDFRPLRMFGMPRNQISGLSACSECPEIRFPASPCVRNAQKSDFRPLRMFGMPRNQISGLSVCLECPEIRFPVSPCVWNARKSDLRICRTTSLPEHDVDGGAKCHRVKNCLASAAFALGHLHKIFRIELRRIEAVIKKESDAQLRLEYIRDRDACREIGVKLVADLGDFDLLGLFGFFLVKREKRVVADVVDTQQELAANKEMIGHGVRKIGADACGDVVERV